MFELMDVDTQDAVIKVIGVGGWRGVHRHQHRFAGVEA